MLRTLVIIRHAKSDQNVPATADFDRPLNQRGKADAPVMGKRLAERGLMPDLIISSSANRAISTARLIAEAIHYAPKDILTIDQLYHASPEVMRDTISTAGIADAVATLFLVAHNPGITYFANETVRGFSTDNMPTCAMVGMQFDSDSWADFYTAEPRFLFYDYPKNI